MNDAGIEHEEHDPLEEDRIKGLRHLRDLGPNKPLGYLSIDLLKSYYRSSVEEEIDLAKQNKLDYLVLGPTECTIGFEGAIYVYDQVALASLLNENEAIITKYNWPNDPKGFIRRIAIEQVPDINQDLYKLIARAFGN